MPTTPTLRTVALVNLSEQLKRRLVSTGRGSKSNLSTELPCPTEPAEPLPEVAPAAEPLTATPPVSNWDSDLSRVVAEAVSSSLAAWQTQFAESIFQAGATAPKDSVNSQADGELQSPVLQELEVKLSDTRQQLTAANDQLIECQTDLKYWRGQLERAADRIAEMEFSQLHTSSNDEDKGLLEQFKLQLDDSLNELADLREQNSDLAAKLAQQVAYAVTSRGSAGLGSGEQLSWEERKLLILKQLEGDNSTSSAGIPHHDKIEIQEIIDSSQLEITRRDEEIEELREIIRMQSDARAGVAIGAAGVAQMIDSDELVQHERQKLREIQQEWEDKLRQAEIDLSMERAKIARERIAMEKQKEEVSQMQLPTAPKEKIMERRWLRILGLKDDGENR